MTLSKQIFSDSIVFKSDVSTRLLDSPPQPVLVAFAKRGGTHWNRFRVSRSSPGQVGLLGVTSARDPGCSVSSKPKKIDFDGLFDVDFLVSEDASSRKCRFTICLVSSANRQVFGDRPRVLVREFEGRREGDSICFDELSVAQFMEQAHHLAGFRRLSLGPSHSPSTSSLFVKLLSVDNPLLFMAGSDLHVHHSDSLVSHSVETVRTFPGSFQFFKVDPCWVYLIAEARDGVRKVHRERGLILGPLHVGWLGFDIGVQSEQLGRFFSLLALQGTEGVAGATLDGQHQPDARPEISQKATIR